MTNSPHKLLTQDSSSCDHQQVKKQIEKKNAFGCYMWLAASIVWRTTKVYANLNYPSFFYVTFKIFLNGAFEFEAPFFHTKGGKRKRKKKEKHLRYPTPNLFFIKTLKLSHLYF